MSFRFGLVGTNPFNIRSLPPLTFLVNLIQLTLANLYNAAMSSSALIVYSRKRTERHNCRMSVSIRHFRENISGQEEALFRMTAGSCYVLTYRAVCHGVSPGTRKDICIITAAVAAVTTENYSFETTISNEIGFTGLRPDKARVAICAPQATHSIAFLV